MIETLDFKSSAVAGKGAKHGRKFFGQKDWTEFFFLRSVYLSVCQLVCLLVCLSACLFVYLLVCLFVRMFVCLSVCLFALFVSGKKLFCPFLKLTSEINPDDTGKKNYYFKEIFCLCLFFQEVKNGVKGFDCHQQNCWQISNFEEIASSLMDP